MSNVLVCVLRRTFFIGGGLFRSEEDFFRSEKDFFQVLLQQEKVLLQSPKGVNWTLEYSSELEFSNPFREQWTLDVGGVLKVEQNS